MSTNQLAKMRLLLLGCALFLMPRITLASSPPATDQSLSVIQQATPAILPLVVTTEGRTYLSGEPIHLSIRLTNNSKQTCCFVDEGRAFDWNLEVYWLGKDGLQKPAAIHKTYVGEEELRESNVTEYRRFVRLLPGDKQSFGPEVLSRLFDMTRSGVYTIRASHSVSDDFGKNKQMVASTPVRIVVQ